MNQKNLLFCDIGPQFLSDFSLSRNNENQIYGLAKNGDLFIWKIDGNFDEKLTVNLQGKINTNSIKFSHFLIPHLYVNNAVFTISDKNTLNLCDMGGQKVVDKRILAELDQIYAAKISKNREMAEIYLSDTNGKILGIDGRAKHSEKGNFVIESKIYSSQLFEIPECSYLGIIGREMAERKIKLYDLRNPKEYLQILTLDSLHMDPLISHYDEDTKICISASNKTEKFFINALSNDSKLKTCNQMNLSEEIIGYSILPKICVNVKNVEIFRLAALYKNNSIKLLPILVPKKNVFLGT